MLDPNGELHQPGDPARRRRPPAALHRRPGRGPRRRAALRRGAHRQHPAPRPRRRRPTCCARRLLEAARDFATEPDDRRRRHPRHPADVADDRRTPSCRRRTERALAGQPATRRRRSSPRQGKLFVRDRLALLLDEGSFVEDALLANAAAERPARRRRGHRRRPGRRPAGVRDGQRPDGEGRLVGRPHRREDRAAHRVRPAPRAAGRSGWSTRPAPASPTRSSCSRAGGARAASSTTRCGCRGGCPQICCLFGPSAAGGAYIPRFCDIVIMVEGNASMYLGSPRMAEMVIGETDHARGDGRRPHARHRVGLRRQPRRRRRRRHRAGPGAYFTYLPVDLAGRRRRRTSRRSRPATLDRRRWCPPRSAQGYDMHDVIDGLVDAESLLRGQAAVRPRADRRLRPASTAGRSASWPTTRCSKGGVLFVDSADKAARFIWWCDAFNVPLVFLADVPGFMIGTQVERQGIIRHGAKMVTAVVRGHRAEGVGDRAQGLRRRALRHVRARPSSPRPRSPCPPPRSR